KESNDAANNQQENSYMNVDNVVSKEETPKFQTDRMESSNSSDGSRPPGFEHFKNSKKDLSFSYLQSKSGKCSTHFSNLRSKDIRGISVIHELPKLIEVGDKLGYDDKGCHKSLHRLIDIIEVLMVDK
nr:RNA-directed DNA polymerase, eukaryota [Tanacetum cinerariifolium]